MSEIVMYNKRQTPNQNYENYGSITNYDNITALWIQQTVIILVSTKMDTLIILRENLFFITKKIMQDYLS